MQWGLWLPLAAALLCAVAAGTVFVAAHLRARRSARALGKALVDQAEANAKPERQVQIRALREQMAQGIGALEKSRIAGKARGGNALYALPWYAIIGPP